jgi:hypothetical protein
MVCTILYILAGRIARDMASLSGQVFDMINDANREVRRLIPAEYYRLTCLMMEGNRRAAVLYPALAALICISPDRLDLAIGALEGTTKVSNKVCLISANPLSTQMVLLILNRVIF